MSTSPIQATTVIQDLAKAITSKYDADANGSLSADEFSGFLSSFLGSMKNNPLTAAATSPAASTSPLATAAVTERAKVGTMAGFDAAKLASLSHTSPKYQVGRILQQFPNTAAGLKDALPELQKLVPGVSIAGSKGDKLDFGGYTFADGVTLNVIDVIQSAGTGGTAWQWAPE
ncbi:MAG: hypothetical protein ABI211_08775 [Vicinamibacterales bacterium]